MNHQFDRPLMIWLSGNKHYLKSPDFIQYEGYSAEAAWVFIDQVVQLHEVTDVPLTPFDIAWEKTLTYISDACSILQKDRSGWAPGSDDARVVLDRLGLPPVRCYALYFITVSNSDYERCVYIGQTNSKKHRFSGGHAAITKLHAPEYDGLSKQVYFAGIQIEDDDDHSFPIEWIHPEEVRAPILSSVESRLIYDLQPDLNIQGKRAFTCDLDLPISTQNIMGGFLDAQVMGPPRPEYE